MPNIWRRLVNDIDTTRHIANVNLSGDNQKFEEDFSHFSTDPSFVDLKNIWRNLPMSSHQECSSGKLHACLVCNPTTTSFKTF